MTIDIIFVADTRRESHYRMTEASIESCRESEDIDMNFIVVDGNKETRGFKDCKTITYDFEFNYNRCLNVGLQFCSSDFVALCNNDLLFHKDWAKNIINAMGKKYLSASPYDRNTRLTGIRRGYEIAKEVKGWCIVIQRRLLKIIGELATPVNFWFSDNVYAEQLKKHKVKHILCYDSRVYHLKSKTLMISQRKNEYTKGQGIIYKEWKDSYTIS